MGPVAKNIVPQPEKKQVWQKASQKLFFHPPFPSTGPCISLLWSSNFLNMFDLKLHSSHFSFPTWLFLMWSFSGYGKLNTESHSLHGNLPVLVPFVSTSESLSFSSTVSFSFEDSSSSCSSSFAFRLLRPPPQGCYLSKWWWRHKSPHAMTQIGLDLRLCARIAAVILDNRLSCAALTFGRISFCLWQIPHLNTTTLWANK